ncbi:TolC family protein [Azohydromonas aeria]|uniref:TolC family protein n=1 Tax=Azohydromonas aeria TaxID=2590212 RepID=UPI0012F81B62|nr:TolC family protein [Azohydromonas aeria]
MSLVPAAWRAACALRRRAAPARRLPPALALALATVAFAPSAHAATLDELVAAAMGSYPSVQAARANAAAAESELGTARWGRYPSVSVETASAATAGAMRGHGLVRVDQPLWAGGRIESGIERAERRLAAAQAGVEEAQTDVGVRATQAWAEAQRQARRAALLDESLREHERLVESMRRRVQQEVSPASDLQLAVARALQVEADRQQALGGLDAALARLSELAGRRVQAAELRELRLEPARDQVAPAGLLDEALAFDARLRRLGAEAQAAESEVALRRAALLPQVNLRYERQRHLPEQVYVVLQAQTDAGLSRLTERDAASRRREAAQQSLQAAERELRDALGADLSENRFAFDRVRAGAAAADAAQGVTDSFLRQFTAGRRTWSDVLNAVRDAVAARLALADAQASAVASGARLRLRSGRWQPLQNPTPAAAAAGEMR